LSEDAARPGAATAAARFPRRGAWLAALACLALLAPFLGRPLHTDDPLFVRQAQHLAAHPFDPYGFDLDWRSFPERFLEVSQNPSLGAYLLVPAGVLSGWSERALHLWGLVPALALVLGTYALASALTRRPLVAALAALGAPALLVSATTVLCDVPMAALWVWAVVLWRRGHVEGRSADLALAALLAGLAAVTKYSALGLVPLLAADGLARRRRPGAWMLPLALPLALFAGHELWTALAYGRGHFATTRAVLARLDAQDKRAQLVDALGFTGAGVCGLVTLAPVLVSRRTALAGLALAALAAALLLVPDRAAVQAFLGLRWPPSAAVLVQTALWSVAGLGLLALAAADLRATRDADGLLLVLWVLGTFVTTAFVKWWVDARGVLPLVPAAAILIARRIDRRERAGRRVPRALVAAGLAASVALAWIATWADDLHARSARDAARTLLARYGAGPATLRFSGHWGFQYYLEQGGAVPWVPRAPRLRQGDLVVLPRNNTEVRGLPAGLAEQVEILTFPTPRWVTTLNPGTAGFHSAFWGPVPYAFGPVPWKEEYLVARAIRDVGF
jgi:Dolichyl-phosphate-mannose-protein mannosyltransferase